MHIFWGNNIILVTCNMLTGNLTEIKQNLNLNSANDLKYIALDFNNSNL